MSNSRHVTPKGGKWQVKKAGATRASGIFDTQAAAIESGRNQAKANKEEFVIHNREGRIRQKDSYGNDPRKSKG